MQQTFSLQLSPQESADNKRILQILNRQAGIRPDDCTGFYILKRSIDARSRIPKINLTVMATLKEPFADRSHPIFDFKNVSNAQHTVLIIGAGPAGLFAALELLQEGIRPIILERGKNVRDRRRDLALLNKTGEVNPDSNYCFGEGGAGTYSDGKLYTRSTKRGDINRILDLFVHFGATDQILYEAHPHIGTNKLPQIITAMREQIIVCGGAIHFEERVTDLDIRNERFHAAITQNGNRFEADACILATGHSARDIFELLKNRNLLIESKPFALGVRIEHPQSLIDSIQYHCSIRDPYLPPAAYAVVEQVQDKGVFSFCMCPGGIIAPAATAPEELVVNGWSPSKRNNPYANSGMVVEVTLQDILQPDIRKFFPELHTNAEDPLALMAFQQQVEKAAFRAGGGKFVAPAQRMTDFSRKKVSSSLPDCSYLPGITSSPLETVLPPFIHERLRLAFPAFGKKMRGYFTEEAIIVATESRTSSPVRIPRTSTFHHPQVSNLYPCGEGAGYAGGIVSAAMDGQKLATTIARSCKTYTTNP